MSKEDSDSDEFLSADEYSNDDELSTVNKKTDVPRKPESLPEEIDKAKDGLNSTIDVAADEEPLQESLSISFEVSEASFEIDEETQAKSYRKRPERRRQLSNPQKTEPNSIIEIVRKPDLKPIIDIVKVARPEAIVSNLTSHLTTNISKGFATFQGTSSSLKGIVSNLAGDTLDEECGKFVYDDDRTRGEDEDTDDKNGSEESQNLPNIPAEQAEPETQMEPEEELEEIAPQPNFNEAPMTSSITDEILKLSEAFEKLKQTRLSENSEPVLVRKLSNEVGVCANLEQAQENDNEIMSPEKTVEEVKDEIAMDGWDEWKDDEVEILDESKTVNNAFEQLSSLKEDATIAATSLVQDIEESVGQLSYDSLLPPALPSKSVEEAKEEGWDDWDDEEEEASEKSLQQLEVVRDEVVEKDNNVNNIETKEIPDGESITTIETLQETNIENAKSKAVEEIVLKSEETNEEEHGWDDWGENDDEVEKAKEPQTSQEDDGWGDWGDDDLETATEQEKPQQKIEQCSPVQSSATKPSESAAPEWGGWDSFGEKKDTTSTQWGIGGWGINSLLSKATAVTSNLSAVTQGLSNVIESGLGVPDPETMARIHAEEEKSLKDSGIQIEEKESSPFPFGNIVSGVGKIVEVAKVQEIGSRVLSGGLDTLETIGKKTMEVLQDGDPGLKKKKALLMGKGKMLSDVLKEARDRAIAEEKQAGLQAALKRCHFETLFDDYQGLMHLEALEMLSRQCELRLEQVQQGLSAGKLRELRDTMEEITQLCEIDEDFDTTEVDDFKESLTDAALPLSNELSIAKILEVHDRMVHWLKEAETLEPPAIYDYAISILAELTAAVTMQFHKSGELLLLKERRKTVEEADALLQLSSIICSELTSTSNKIAGLLKKSESAETLTGNLRVETENAVAYIKQAFALLVPVLQLGAT